MDEVYVDRRGDFRNSEYFKIVSATYIKFLGEVAAARYLNRPTCGPATCPICVYARRRLQFMHKFNLKQ